MSKQLIVGMCVCVNVSEQLIVGMSSVVIKCYISQGSPLRQSGLKVLLWEEDRD